MRNVKINVALGRLRAALWSGRDLGVDPQTRARVIAEAARELDSWLSEGGELPDDWREDRVSSASRQHYIDTGRYLTREDYADERTESCGSSTDRQVLDELALMLGEAEDGWRSPADYLESIADLVARSGRPHPGGTIPADRYRELLDQTHGTARSARQEAS